MNPYAYLPPVFVATIAAVVLIWGIDAGITALAAHNGGF